MGEKKGAHANEVAALRLGIDLGMTLIDTDEIAESVRAQSQTSSHRCDRSLPVALAREKYAPRGNRGDVRETSVCRKDPALGRFKFRRRRYAGTARHRIRFRLRHEPSPLQSRKSRDRIRSSTVPYIKHQASNIIYSDHGLFPGRSRKRALG